MLREASAYFAGEGQLCNTLCRLRQRLAAEAIPYALLGGLPLTLADKLDPWVQPTYRELWEKTQAGKAADPHEPSAR